MKLRQDQVVHLLRSSGLLQLVRPPDFLHPRLLDGLLWLGWHDLFEIWMRLLPTSPLASWASVLFFDCGGHHTIGVRESSTSRKNDLIPRNYVRKTDLVMRLVQAFFLMHLHRRPNRDVGS